MSRPSWIGYRLSDRYQIEELLGQGGMSAVYRAVDPNLRRSVAIKLIHSHISQDADFLRRFTDEAANVAQLSHPNIIQVYDFNQDQGSYYMVLELIDGVTLQERLADLQAAGEMMTYAEVVSVVANICDALHYAHERGLLHRDIKPANVMLRNDGRAVLMDFGIAKILGGTNLTGTGAIIGTVQYIAPEVVEGNDPDHRIDIYAIGVMLYEMLSGKPPYDADSALAVLMKHINEPVPDLRNSIPEMPTALAEIVEKTLAKEPANRFQSARELASALRSADLTVTSTVPIPRTELIDVKQATAPSSPTPVKPTPMPAAASQPPPATPAAPAAPPPIRTDGMETSSKKGGPNPLIFVGLGGVAVFVGIIALGILLLSGMFGGNGDDPNEELQIAEGATDSSGASNEGTTSEVPASDEEEAIADPTAIPEVVADPTATPMATPSPTATAFPEPYVFISNITLDGSTYIVEYETFGYQEALPGEHVHFFFNTVPPEQAGAPNGGPWQVWGGPRPFDAYTTLVKPADATQICALYAYPDHSIELNTGNCVDIPEAEVGQ